MYLGCRHGSVTRYQCLKVIPLQASGGSQAHTSHLHASPHTLASRAPAPPPAPAALPQHAAIVTRSPLRAPAPASASAPSPAAAAAAAVVASSAAAASASAAASSALSPPPPLLAAAPAPVGVLRPSPQLLSLQLLPLKALIIQPGCRARPSPFTLLPQLS
jgi:hypothetical protein